MMSLLRGTGEFVASRCVVVPYSPSVASFAEIGTQAADPFKYRAGCIEASC